MKTADTANQTTDEILEYMRQKGVIAKIQEERQKERETERADLFTEIDTLSRRAAEEVPPALEKMRMASRIKTLAEEALQAAKIGVMSAEQTLAAAAHSSYRAEMSKGKLAQLADPRIHAALIMLRAYFDSYRRKDVVIYTTSEKNFMGRKVRTEYGNDDEVGTVGNTIKQAMSAMEELLYQPRPADMQEIIDAHLSAVDTACRKLGVDIPIRT